MQLTPNNIHVWSVQLAKLFDHEKSMAKLLDQNESCRADAFRLPLHRQRFIIAHGILRELLAAYTGIPAADLQFGYNEYKKPFLSPLHRITFNLTHSDDIAVYAMTINQAIGVDIEKIKSTFNISVAKRFFSDAENNHLSSLPEAEQANEFYRLWARKEAVIKAVGKGLFIPLPSFSVLQSTIELEAHDWTIYPLELAAGYQAALACEKNDMTLTCHDYFLDHEKLSNVSRR